MYRVPLKDGWKYVVRWVMCFSLSGLLKSIGRRLFLNDFWVSRKVFPFLFCVKVCVFEKEGIRVPRGSSFSAAAQPTARRKSNYYEPHLQRPLLSLLFLFRRGFCRGKTKNLHLGTEVSVKHFSDRRWNGILQLSFSFSVEKMSHLVHKNERLSLSTISKWNKFRSVRNHFSYLGKKSFFA